MKLRAVRKERYRTDRRKARNAWIGQRDGINCGQLLIGVTGGMVDYTGLKEPQKVEGRFPYTLKRLPARKPEAVPRR
jgi:hypothetical protein